MTDTKLAVIRAAVDLVAHWHARQQAGSVHIDGPRLVDLEDTLADAVHEWSADD